MALSITSLAKASIKWDGFIGAPGYTIIYFDDTGAGLVYDQVLTSWQSFLGSVGAFLPLDVTITFPTNGVTINPQTGFETGAWTAPGRTQVDGSDPLAYSAATGCGVQWRTNELAPSTKPNKGPHLLRGKTFMVPLAAAAFGDDGQVLQNVCNTINAAAQSNIVAGGRTVVWHRPGQLPRNPDGSPGGPDPAHPGGWAHITAANTPTKPVVLRSRRD